MIFKIIRKNNDFLLELPAAPDMNKKNYVIQTDS